MKLDVPIPTGWETRRVDEGLLVQAPSTVHGMLVMPLGPADPDPELWMRRAFAYRARVEDGEPRDLAMSPFATDAGWSGLLLDGKLGTQARFVVYLAFMDYAATVVGMCRVPAELASWRAELLALVAKATPDFTSERPACLAHQLGAAPRSEAEHRARHAIAGWHRTFAAGDLVLTHLAHPGAGAIRIAADVTPIEPVAKLFAGLADPEIVATDESEYAAIAHTPARVLAVVLGAHTYTRIDATITDAAHAELFRATVEELARSATLGLGPGRWRPYYYEPPPGWTGIARPHATLWLAPATPRRHHVMRVFDARPPRDHEAAHGLRMFETLPQEFFREPPKGPAIYYTADDLECRVFVHSAQLPLRAEPLKVLEGMIVSERYVYPIRMECDPALLEESMHVFERVVASVRLLPEPHRRSSHGGAVAYWAE